MCSFANEKWLNLEIKMKQNIIAAESRIKKNDKKT